MADHGLEWIFRLGIEPRRMWRRYLLGNPMFLWRVMNERQLQREEPPVEISPVPTAPAEMFEVPAPEPVVLTAGEDSRQAA
jgi:N-acetylglucosaminyldiphosphoundecaprenol N-acetyl-beta-D-mannosaminyltransferase